MNQTPKGNRTHIAIFGKRNVGKSSLINALTDQPIAIVSEVPGTTTDPVKKAMELLPLGPVLIIDTAGIDDIGKLGSLRVEKTLEVLNQTDVALVVVHWKTGLETPERQLISLLKEKAIPFLVVVNQIDQRQGEASLDLEGLPFIEVSAKTKEGILPLKKRIAQMAPQEVEVNLVAGLVGPGDHVLLVTPIDSAAPKGRMILPQVQTIRAILDQGGVMSICKETEVGQMIKTLGDQLKLVITDSQVFHQVGAQVPETIPLTSFSILFARQKGDLKALVDGAKAVASLKPGDPVLIVEGCTHHRQGDDIGKVKIPRWLEQQVQGKLNFTWLSGTAFEEDLSQYRLVIHCGSCMHNRREMLHRISGAQAAGVPMVNYGVLIAHLMGIGERALVPFKEELC